MPRKAELPEVDARARAAPSPWPAACRIRSSSSAKAEPRSLAEGPYLHEVSQRLLDDAPRADPRVVPPRRRPRREPRDGLAAGARRRARRRAGAKALVGASRDARARSPPEPPCARRPPRREVPSSRPRPSSTCASRRTLSTPPACTPSATTPSRPARPGRASRSAELLGRRGSSLRDDAALPAKPSVRGPWPTWLASSAAPGRDPRGPFVPFRYRADVRRLEDLKPGLVCPGLVTNVTSFGVFVDVGVPQDGLVHVSQLPARDGGDPRAGLCFPATGSRCASSRWTWRRSRSRSPCARLRRVPRPARPARGGLRPTASATAGAIRVRPVPTRRRGRAPRPAGRRRIGAARLAPDRPLVRPGRRWPASQVRGPKGPAPAQADRPRRLAARASRAAPGTAERAGGAPRLQQPLRGPGQAQGAEEGLTAGIDLGPGAKRSPAPAASRRSSRSRAASPRGRRAACRRRGRAGRPAPRRRRRARARRGRAAAARCPGPGDCSAIFALPRNTRPWYGARPSTTSAVKAASSE